MSLPLLEATTPAAAWMILKVSGGSGRSPHLRELWSGGIRMDQVKRVIDADARHDASVVLEGQRCLLPIQQYRLLHARVARDD